MILVVAEQQDGTLNRASWEAWRRRSRSARRSRWSCLARAWRPWLSALAAAEVAKWVALEHAALEVYTPDGFTEAIAAFITAESPAIRDFSAHLSDTRFCAEACSRGWIRAIATDCTGVKSSGGAPVFVRQMFQGKVNADVVLEGAAPHLATFQIGAFRADAVKKGGAPAPVRTAAATVDPSKIRQKPEAPFREAKQAVDLSQADRSSPSAAASRARSTSRSRSSWRTRSAPSSPRRARSATPAGCRWNGRSAAPARRSRRSSTSRSASPAPSSTWSA
jgi:electron transfer flavoprotein alpha subunit